MSDYDEHLISMAGGDGEADLDATIEARVDAAATALYAFSAEAASGTPFSERHFIARNRYLAQANAALESADVPALLAMVREQRAVIEALEADIDGELQDAEPSNYEEDNYDAGYIAGLTYAQDKLRAAITKDAS